MGQGGLGFQISKKLDWFLLICLRGMICLTYLWKMTDNELKKIYPEVCGSIAGRRLKPAFDRLGTLISENGLGVLHDRHRNLEETYQYMLKYTVEGVTDPERQKVYHKLIVSAFELADLVNEELRMKFSTSAEYYRKRALRQKAITDTGQYISELENYYIEDAPSSREGKEQGANSSAKASEHHKKMQGLFYNIWFSDNLSPEETDRYGKFLQNPMLPSEYRSFMVTAIMLSLQRFFDPEKFTLLFQSYDSGDAGISQRALVGLLICLYRYDERMPFYPQITGRFKILNENPAFKRNLERIIIQLVRSKETEKLQKRIRDEILPEMIKISPNLRNKINLDSLMEEGLSEGKNPEWEDILKDSPGLLNKMEEFSEMQMKGSDVFMGSFSMLKSFPFFNEMSNWFIPFFPGNTDLAGNVDSVDPVIRQMVESIGKAPILCNSDKYSFCLSISRIPRENIEFMTQAMKAEMEQVEELKEDEELLDPGRREEFVSNQYIQDLYRFYKLFPGKAGFEDIFGWRLDFHNKMVLGDILREDDKVLRNIGEYYFAKDHYREAAEIFTSLLEQDKSGELYQKVAWCYQKRGKFRFALDNYLKAELYEVNRIWNTRKIAFCYRHLKKPDKALEYYREAEKLDPENLSVHLSIGHCLLELDRYDEALQSYFRVEYLTPGNSKVWRPIAWCSFLTGKKEQAEKYFLKLMEEQPTAHDLVNMGHVQWSLGRRREALEYYRRAIAKPEQAAEKAKGSAAGTAEEQAAGKAAEKAKGSAATFSEAEFLAVFEEDIPHLVNQGVDSDDIPIMLDQLRYLLSG